MNALSVTTNGVLRFFYLLVILPTKSTLRCLLWPSCLDRLDWALGAVDVNDTIHNFAIAARLYYRFLYLHIIIIVGSHIINVCSSFLFLYSYP
jgi:hypothetical protein